MTQPERQETAFSIIARSSNQELENRAWTDTGMGHMFVDWLGRIVRYVIDADQWYVWDGNHWVPDTKTRVHVINLTQEVLRQLRQQITNNNSETLDTDRDRQLIAINQWESLAKKRAMLDVAATDARIQLRVADLDADPFTLVVKNGTLDLRTQTLRESRSEDHCTQVADVTYDANARCPEWLKHIELISQHKNGAKDPALAAFLQRWAGYTLTGLVTEQKFFFGFGEGNNGKNVLIETLLGMLGTYAIRGSAQILTGSGREHETIIADLAGARMVFIDETPHGRINEARVKALTGSSRMRARKIAKDSFEFDARFKLWIAGNNKPRVADTSKGFWRRLDLVPFDTIIENRIIGFTETLRAEWSGILNWCLEGLRDYLELGGLGEPSRVTSAGEEYREEENVFGQFVDEYFDRTCEHAWTPNNALYAAYRSWCEDAGIRFIPSMQQLSNDWRQAGFEQDKQPKRIKQGWTIAGGGTSKTHRGWVGPPLRQISPVYQWEGMYKVGVTDDPGAEV